ncbi:class E sortase [Amycolatopsis cihanbeyliensis]|uniref:class E sortase n=1 Tax=Amycolatopsis cihanbeyliensis TaxID=1128664 RepID=UPI0014773FC7|nr:class E sortase [Amycolatopsis cihanbeyliensis]
MGEICVTLGIVALLFVAYKTWGQLGELQDAQAELDHALEQQWTGLVAPDPTVDQPAAAPGTTAPRDRVATEGQPLVRLSIPRLGLRWVVTEGTTQQALRSGPGHYRGTQMPGEIGNFAVAGHRIPGVFWDLDELAAGDVIEVEGPRARYTYQVTGTRIVGPNASAELAPLPGQTGAQPTESRLVLTTCNPKWDNYQRLIVEAQLQSETPRG